MQKDLEALCVALDNLSIAVKNGWSGDATFGESWGWNCPVVTRHDMANVPSRLAKDIRNANVDELDKSIELLVQEYPRRILYLSTNTVPQFWGGNAGVATSVYMVTLDSIRQSLTPYLAWQVIPDPKAIPANLAKKIRAMQIELDQISPNKDQLAAQIHDIQHAHSVAESLPLDLQALSDARDRVVRLADESASFSEKSKSITSQTIDEFVAVQQIHLEAQKLIEQCDAAYHITTTRGLAAAFDQRASRLGWSMGAWVLGLLVALAVGAWIGSVRVELLSKALSAGEPQWGVIWLHIVLSLLSVGAPIWFAWMATKQIGQRFRLAEDYAFKASVAKAYEGYRKEAARIDPAFEARLFSSALTRLEEAPLRLVEQETHGSPWHELFSSPQFQHALTAIPELKTKFIEVARQGASGIIPNRVVAASKAADAELEK